jgi:putative alpha-1,2-mannosidase
VEYSCNDFGLHQVATGLKKHQDAKKYLNRSRNWRNHWDPDQTSLGFSGFLVPRNSSGFIPSDPLTNDGYWGDPFYEASSWAYSWNAVHDMEHVIDLMGGAERTVDRLNTMFIDGASGSSGMIFDPTNEP